MDFDWDPAKNARNVAERGFGFDFAATIFRREVLEEEDTRRNYGEVRMKAIGEAGGFVLFVVYTDRGTIRRIISARRANQEERRLWHAR